MFRKYLKINISSLSFTRSIFLAALFSGLCLSVSAQEDTTITSIDPELEAIFTQKIPKEYEIASVTVSGNNFFDNSLLISIANISVGDKVRLPGDDIFSKAIQNLWKQNYFSNATIYLTKLEKPNKLHIEIEVQERPRLGKYSFRGVKKGESEDLMEKVGLVAGRIVTENSRLSAKEAITKFYTEKGYRNVAIAIEETPSKNIQNSIDLVFDVNKGSKVKIGDVFISGNDNINAMKVKRQMKGTKEMARATLYPQKDTPMLGKSNTLTAHELLENMGYLQPTNIKNALDPYFRFKLSSAKFNDKKFEEDKEKIISFYNSKGYRDSRIEKDTLYQGKSGNLVVEVKLDEGRQYYFGDIKFRGNTKYNDSILNLILDIRKGEVYNKETLDKRLGKQMSPDGGADLSALYMDDGYLFFSAEAVETRVYNDTIDFEIRVFEGPQATIKNVSITGNEKTKEFVIRRELRTIPGEKFRRSDLIRSQREIANLNFFNQETIGINPVPDPTDGTVDINYSVEEKSSDQLELSAGWGGGIGLTGTLGVTFNNFSIRNIFKKDSWDPLPSGEGQKLSVRYQSNGNAFRSANISFTEPWLGGKRRNAFTLSFYNTKFSNAFNPATGQFERFPSSFIKTSGASVALGKQLRWPDDYFNFQVSLGYMRYTLQDYQFFEDFRNGISNNLNMKFTLSRSSVDQPLFPRSGSNFMASLQVTPPWSLINKDQSYETTQERYQWIEFHKWRFNAETFVPLGRPHGAEKNHQFVLKLAAKYGFLGRYNTELDISPFERFQVGDAGLTNQFALIGFDVIAHRGYPVYQTSNPKVNPDQQGASRYFTIFNKYTAEVRYPLSTNPSSTIYALGFFEAANGWYSLKEYNPFLLRRSVGLGMRFFLPMFGLLGFDYGIGLDRMQPGQGFKDATRFTFMLGFEPE
ncbi:MAG: outer membrane protein assembly factor [Chitinophagaceae bacterium]|nr:outer membrane protein assembly factor [Chitinophagaceae bacterium]